MGYILLTNFIPESQQLMFVSKSYTHSPTYTCTLTSGKCNIKHYAMSKYCVNGRIPFPWVLYIIYRLYKDAIHGKQIKANKFPHDSSPIHVNYNLSNNIC